MKNLFFKYIPFIFISLLSLLPMKTVWSEPQSIEQEAIFPPERVSKAVVPAQIAFIQRGTLWIIDGTKKNSQPVRVNQDGVVVSFSWSSDGQWLAYEMQASPVPYGRDSYLWVADSSGKNTFQVDFSPISITPEWAPSENIIVYSTRKDHNQVYGEGKLARISQAGEAEVTPLYPVEEEVIDMAWHPDGKQIAISKPRTKERPLIIDLLTMDGKRKNALTNGKPVGEDEGIFIWGATGLKWSPNGKYLTYFLEPNSGSLAADGVAIELLDVETRTTMVLGGGLHYKEWLAWSPDSKFLAYIQGGPREAITAKRLYILDTLQSKITNINKEGLIETSPLWSNKAPFELFFLRGQDMKGWNIQLPQVLVPDQRIWRRTMDGSENLITQGPKNTSDTMPNISPNSNHLLYMRLFQFDRGSIYLKTLPEGKEMELVRGVRGWDHGFYGNYLPPWMKVYWKNASEVGNSLYKKH